MKRPSSSRARRFCGLALSLGMACGAAAFNDRSQAGASGGAGQVRPSNHVPEPAGKIAFASEREGNYEIYVMNPDGGGQVRLTTNPAVDRELLRATAGARARTSTSSRSRATTAACRPLSA
jgi:hypothetical protein